VEKEFPLVFLCIQKPTKEEVKQGYMEKNLCTISVSVTNFKGAWRGILQK